MNLRNSEQLLRVVFQFFVGKIFFRNLKKYFSIRIEKLHNVWVTKKDTKRSSNTLLRVVSFICDSDVKMAFIILFFFFFLKKFEKIKKIGYHSNFNFERNTEVGFKESLGLHVLLFLTFPKICFKLQTHTAMYNRTKRQDWKMLT